MTTYHLSPRSSNVKTGPIPVTTTSKNTCPDACPFKGDESGANGCYADNGPSRINWNKVSRGERGDTLDSLCDAIRAFPKGQLWRHNQAGDLPGENGRINRAQLRKLTDANKGKRGFTYTHKPLTKANVAAIRESNKAGFVVNISANGLHDIARAKAAKAGPVVSVVPSDYGTKTVRDADGDPLTVCPATYRDDVNCESCGLCAIPDRQCIVLFPAHGSQARTKVDKLVSIDL